MFWNLAVVMDAQLCEYIELSSWYVNFILIKLLLKNPSKNSGG